MPLSISFGGRYSLTEALHVVTWVRTGCWGCILAKVGDLFSAVAFGGVGRG